MDGRPVISSSLWVAGNKPSGDALQTALGEYYLYKCYIKGSQSVGAEELAGRCGVHLLFNLFKLILLKGSSALG